MEIDDTSATAVTLILENENTLISQCNKKAGLHKSRGQSGGSNTSTLVIKGDGTLTAQGKDAAGIGAGDYHGDVKASPLKAARSMPVETEDGPLDRRQRERFRVGCCH